MSVAKAGAPVGHRSAFALTRAGVGAVLALASATALAATVPAKLALPEPVTSTAPSRLTQLQAQRPSRIDPALAGAQGTVEVWVKLNRAPLAAAQGENAKTRGGLLSKAERQGYLATLNADHDAVSAAARRLGGEELARVSRAHNAVAVRVDASKLAELASQPGVERIRGVMHYELMLSETVPYVGAALAQAAGKDGTGARVAVFDSGIDYTHRNLGGPGTPEAYQAAVTTFPNPYFPSTKVVGGYDFVGSAWPNGPRTEDANPIDDGPGGGHGTHVADIIGGRSTDGAHKGVAPGAQLLSVKVCSSVSSSCNGVALLKAVDFALDPDRDGTLSPVDVINLSLGSNYGQKEDDLTEALNQASALGVVVVAAAGNAANRPYIVSSPSIGPAVISVAQTQVPSAKVIPLVVNAPPAIAGTYGNTETVAWAPVDRAVTGDVVFVGTACPGQTLQANPAGKVALIDRGTCSVSLKVDAAAKAGATAVIIGLVAAGDAVSFSFGGGDTFVPTLVVTQAVSRALKANAPANVTISPDKGISLAGSMVSTSARGPSISYQTIKPEIGAPGASVSAVYGTGTREEAFGGTSGATPMVAGAAAILVGANPRLEPAQVKALLMNTAETRIFHQPALFPGKLAPVTRIGAGELRVNQALAATTAAWVKKDQSAAISFGYQAVGRTITLEREVRIENLSNRSKTFQVTSAFRDPKRAANAAVKVSVQPAVRVPARGDAELEVAITIDPALLPAWTLDGGPQGGNGLALDPFEVDGYLTLKSGTETLTVPWHVLPHKAAALVAPFDAKADKGIPVVNAGAAPGFVEVFALTGTSPQIPAAQLPAAGDNFAVIDLKAVGARLAGDVPGVGPVMQFAVSTFGGRAHPNYPAEFDIYVDTNLDGDPDFVIFNTENGGFGATGQNLVFVQNLHPATPAEVPAQAFFFTDADLNSSNAILTVPLAFLRLAPGQQFSFSVYAFDNYFTGAQTDAVENMTFTPALPRFTAAGLPDAGIAPRSVGRLTVTEVAGGAAASPSQTGFLLQYRDSDVRDESQAVTIR
jgi:subtilisin family serine protease